MLRRRRSLAALLASSSSAPDSEAQGDAEEDDVPPLPLGLTRASLRVRAETNGVQVQKHVNGRAVGSTPNGKSREKEKDKDKGLIRRVSSLFRSSSAASSTASSSKSVDHGLGLGLAGYKRTAASPASASTPDVRWSGKLVKRASTRRPTHAWGHGVDVDEDEEGEDEEEDDIRRPSGLGRAASLSLSPSLSPSPSPTPSPSHGSSSTRGPAPPRPPRSALRSLPEGAAANAERVGARARRSAADLMEESEDEDEEDGEEEDDIRRPAGLGRPASLRSLLAEGERSGFASGLPSAFATGAAPRARTRSTPLPPTLRALLLPASSPVTGARSPTSPSSFSSLPPSSPTHNLRSASSHTARRDASLASGNGMSRQPARTLTGPLWARVLAHLPLRDACAAARVCRVVCAGARGRIYGGVDLRGAYTTLYTTGYAGAGGREAGGPWERHDEKRAGEEGERVQAGRGETQAQAHAATTKAQLAQRGGKPRWSGACARRTWRGTCGRLFVRGGRRGAGARTRRWVFFFVSISRRASFPLPTFMYTPFVLTPPSSLRASILPSRAHPSPALPLPPPPESESRPTHLNPFRPPSLPPSPPFSALDSHHIIHLPALRTLTIFPAPTPSSAPSAASPPSSPSPSAAPPSLSPREPRAFDTRALLAFLRAHSALERLAVLGAEDADDDTDADDERGREIDAEKDGEEFLPRLTHLHAPPALAARILPRLTRAAPPLPTSSAASSPALGRTANDNATAPNGMQKGLSAAALARLAPDPHPKRGWHRVRSHNAEVEALAGKILAAERARGAGAGASVFGAHRIPRKPVPVLSLSDAEAAAEGEVVRAGVVKGRKATARAVYVRPPGLDGDASGDGGKGRVALRVLRIAVARPMYEAGAGVGGGRVGRAVGEVLARASGDEEGRGEEGEGEGLALHVLFGPRVERRTIEKVLRTLGAGVGEGLAAPNATTTDGTRITKGAAGLALLEVRSAVRAAELYKVMHAVLPRFPALHTLLLTRPPALYPPRPAEPPSPRSPSFFFPSPPATPGFPPPPAVPHARAPGKAPLSLRVPPSPSFRGPPSPSLRSSPSPSMRGPPSPAPRSPFPPSPSMRSSPSPVHSVYASAPFSPARPPPPGLPTPAAAASPEAACAWEWDGWNGGGAGGGGARLQGLEDIDADMDGLSEEDAAHVSAWRRHCAPLACVRLLSGAWWVGEGEGEGEAEAEGEGV
ncbi:hypothetical protein DFH09DRAFT_1507710 [Mycena vulgaris]|nr:hypothetical protein DFH09DRAFT_1507710 [Mycena vulgaris]